MDEPTKELTKEEEKAERFKEVTAELIYRGVTPAQIAKALHPEDKRERNKMRKSLLRMVRRDADFAAKIAEKAHGEMVMSLGRVTRALIKRAERGRPDAIKIIFEASGFHNPRIKHDHSGNIAITLNIPRPEEPEKPKKVPNLERGEDDPPVVDAEVVGH